MSSEDIIATVGVGLLLIAFLLQILKVITSDGLAYSLLNFIGAGISGYASWLIPFYPFVVLEAVWSLVALYSLLKYFKNKRST
jgi:ABC-type maltose transport system permease subunit